MIGMKGEAIYDELMTLMMLDSRLISGGILQKKTIICLAKELDRELLTTLHTNEKIREVLFKDLGDFQVFDFSKFELLVSQNSFIPDSFTSYKNRIGLSSNDEFISNVKEVVLSWPYKDSVLEGGQTKSNAKQKEVFWNTTIASEEIDRLFSPKALTNFKRFENQSDDKCDTLGTNENLLIKGNNLITLHTLKHKFSNKIKLIYIDPPYNTGKDSFGYNDSFNHSSWLTFMKNRLEVARELLKDDGVIFISIDINEQAYLKVLCDEIFGRSNFVGEIIWETATDNNATQISIEHEYVISYAKDKTLQPKWQIKSEKATIIENKYSEFKQLHQGDLPAIEKALRNWINSMKKSNEVDLSGVAHYNYVDEKGVFYPGNSANTKPGGYNFDIIHPITKVVCSKPANGYRWPETTFWSADANGDVLWGGDEQTIPKIKKRLGTATELLKGYYYEDNRRTTAALAKLMGGRVFENPKSINLLKKIIKFTTQRDDIILDFFAGSGSTAQAVLEVNQEEDNRRNFVLCEQMDYIETVTAPRIQKCLGSETFVYCELKSLNHTFIEKLGQALTVDELKKTWPRIKEKGMIRWQVRLQQVDYIIDGVESHNLSSIKKLILEVLDQNMMYLPWSEMLDSEYGMGEKEIKLCNMFFDLQSETSNS
jgi:DNA modification methylase